MSDARTMLAEHSTLDPSCRPDRMRDIARTWAAEHEGAAWNAVIVIDRPRGLLTIGRVLPDAGLDVKREAERLRELARDLRAAWGDAAGPAPERPAQASLQPVTDPSSWTREAVLAAGDWPTIHIL